MGLLVLILSIILYTFFSRTDVANELNISKPSVSRAVSVLKTAGYVEIGAINQLVLTTSGREIAKQILCT